MPLTTPSSRPIRLVTLQSAHSLDSRYHETVETGRLHLGKFIPPVPLSRALPLASTRETQKGVWQIGGERLYGCGSD